MPEQNSGADWAYDLARKRIDQMERVLKSIQWGGNGFCPACGKRKIDGGKHTKTCAIAKCL